MANFSPISGSPSSIHSIASVAPITKPINPTNTGKTKTTKSKPRKRVNTAEKRSQHNAIERARRETLNGKFLSLARLLPSLASSRRPSKSAIVNGSISHLTKQRDQRLLASKILKEVLAERDELLKEVNDWRKINAYQPKEIKHEYKDEIEQINSVENESFGTFSGMEGEADAEDEDQQQEDDESPSTIDSLDIHINNINNTFAQVNGLITPRSSTDLDLALQQNLYNPAPVVDQRAQSVGAGSNGINWSTEFAFNLNQQMGNTTLMNFGETHSSPLDNVSPSSDLANMYQHTPSPGSSHSFGVKTEPAAQVPQLPNVNTNAMPSGWNAQQIAMLQQHAVQANNIMRQHQSQQQAQAQQQLFNPIVGNSFNAMFSSAQPQQHGMGGNTPLTTFHDDSMTQQMLNSMFPRQNEVSLEDIQNAIRAGMGVGMNLANVNNWTSAQA
ncbi:uncharacterized protein L201_002936 [Kwoniella dendrophila CBS 6074]|uniref:BHLH domain-containing protein n=1 Tax=Kwoniella dendrophila CBS 6074 TaxID=1295534 RepID=A0AAX4JU59_9TREE